MQSLGNLNDIVNALLDGLLDLGPTRGEYFVFNSGQYLWDFLVQGLGGLGLGGASKVPKTVVDGNTVKPEYLQIFWLSC